jgi:hypothetical protein
MMVVARPVICRMRAMPRTAAAVPASPRRYGRAARLMRARRAAESPAVPAGSARGAIGAVAHRGEDPPHDGGVPAGSVRRVVIIRSPGRRTRRASRGSLGGFAFDDSHDVEGSHVRHDPPSPRPAQGREPLPPPRHRARTLRPQGPAIGDGTGGSSSYRFRAGNALSDTRPGSAPGGTRQRPVPRPSGTRRCRDVSTRLPAGGACVSLRLYSFIDAPAGRAGQWYELDVGQAVPGSHPLGGHLVHGGIGGGGADAAGGRRRCTG